VAAILPISSSRRHTDRILLSSIASGMLDVRSTYSAIDTESKPRSLSAIQERSAAFDLLGCHQRGQRACSVLLGSGIARARKLRRHQRAYFAARSAWIQGGSRARGSACRWCKRRCSSVPAPWRKHVLVVTGWRADFCNDGDPTLRARRFRVAAAADSEYKHQHDGLVIKKKKKQRRQKNKEEPQKPPPPTEAQSKKKKKAKRPPKRDNSKPASAPPDAAASVLPTRSAGLSGGRGRFWRRGRTFISAFIASRLGSRQVTAGRLYGCDRKLCREPEAARVLSPRLDRQRALAAAFSCAFAVQLRAARSSCSVAPQSTSLRSALLLVSIDGRANPFDLNQRFVDAEHRRGALARGDCLLRVA